MVFAQWALPQPTFWTGVRKTFSRRDKAKKRGCCEARCTEFRELNRLIAAVERHKLG